MVDDHHVVHGLRDLGEHVAGQQDRTTLSGQLAQERAQPADALRVQPVGGLVQDEDLRVAHQCRSQAQTLVHAQREAPGTAVRRVTQLDELEHLLDAGTRHSRLGGDDAQVVAGRTAWVCSGLEHRPDMPQRVDDVAVCVTADAGAARGRGDQAEQSAQGRRLARAVRPEEPRDLPGRDREAQVVHGAHVAVVLGQPADLDDVRGGGVLLVLHHSGLHLRSLAVGSTRATSHRHMARRGGAGRRAGWC